MQRTVSEARHGTLGPRTDYEAVLQEPLLPSSEASRRHADLRAICVMVCSELLLATVNAIVKGVRYSPAQIMLERFSVDLVLSVCVCLLRGYRVPSRGDVAIGVSRGMAYVSGLVFFWGGLRSCLPEGDVVVLLIASSPIFLVLLARAVLRESIPASFLLQMALLVVGAALVNKPGAPAAGCSAWSTVFPVGASVCWAFMNLASRRLKHLQPVQVMCISDCVAIGFACSIAAVQ